MELVDRGKPVSCRLAAELLGVPVKDVVECAQILKWLGVMETGE
jgi:hypothetical protein